MAIVIDNNKKFNNSKPGLHIFIAGVSAYPNLREKTPMPKNSDLEPLTSAAISAFRFYQWIISPNGRLPLEIATCRVLLSPSEKEKANDKELNELLESADFDNGECSRANFEFEIHEWQRDAAENCKNITIFYFAGHGIQLSTDLDLYMLLNDFGSSDNEQLANAANLLNIYDGMAPGKGNSPVAEIARTQFYFVDCCRNRITSLIPPDSEKNYKIFTPELEKVDRHAPIFFATVPGARAFAEPDGQTYFSKSLIDCLNGAAGDDSEKRDEANKTIWHVSTATMTKALPKLFKENAALDIDEQIISIEPRITGDEKIVTLNSPPEVRAKIKVIPEAANGNVRIEFLNRVNNILPHTLDASKDNLIHCRINAGYYLINARIEPPHNSYEDFVDNEGMMMRPPYTDVNRKVG